MLILFPFLASACYKFALDVIELTKQAAKADDCNIITVDHMCAKFLTLIIVSYITLSMISLFIRKTVLATNPKFESIRTKLIPPEDET